MNERHVQGNRSPCLLLNVPLLLRCRYAERERAVVVNLGVLLVVVLPLFCNNPFGANRVEAGLQRGKLQACPWSPSGQLTRAGGVENDDFGGVGGLAREQHFEC